MNMRAAEGIRPEFFSQRSIHLSRQLDGAEAAWAAMSLRADYGHACESVLSLLFASIQAPRCIFGWLHLYKNEDLTELCLRTLEGREYPHMLLESPGGWREIAGRILCRAPPIVYAGDGISAAREEILEGSITALGKIVEDFLDPRGRLEYNAFKHGFRIKQTSMSVEIQPKGKDPIHVEGGRFGSEVINLEKIDKINYGVGSDFVSWDPMQMAARLQVAALWIALLKCFLLIELTDGKARVQWPFLCSAEDYLAPWAGGPSLMSAHIAAVLPPKGFPLAGKEEIMEIYERRKHS